MNIFIDLTQIHDNYGRLIAVEPKTEVLVSADEELDMKDMKKMRIEIDTIIHKYLNRIGGRD